MAATQDIYLRTLVPQDVDFMLQMENDPSIWRVSQTLEPYLLDDIKRFVLQTKHNLFEDYQIRYVIVLSKNEQQIGCVDLFDYDAKKRNAGVGITILKEFREHGYGKAAMRALIDKAFGELRIEELYCNIFTDNSESIKLFESVGFQRIEFLKNNSEYKGIKYDEFFYRLSK